MRVSSAEELGYDFHLKNEDCVTVFKKMMEIGSKYGLKNGGFRAFNSLNCEKGSNYY